jgi:hypothetical protein
MNYLIVSTSSLPDSVLQTLVTCALLLLTGVVKSDARHSPLVPGNYTVRITASIVVSGCDTLSHNIVLTCVYSSTSADDRSPSSVLLSKTSNRHRQSPVVL